MAKRGRPKNPEEFAVHKKQYYKPDPQRDNKAIDDMKKERVVNAYNKLHILAFGTDMSVRLRNRIVELL